MNRFSTTFFVAALTFVGTLLNAETASANGPAPVGPAIVFDGNYTIAHAPEGWPNRACRAFLFEELAPGQTAWQSVLPPFTGKPDGKYQYRSRAYCQDGFERPWWESGRSMTVFVGEPASPALVNDAQVMDEWMAYVVDTYLEEMYSQLGTDEQGRSAIEGWLLQNAQAVVDEGATLFSRDEIATAFKLQLIKQHEGTYGTPGLPGNLDEIITRLDELTDRPVRRLGADIN